MGEGGRGHPNTFDCDCSLVSLGVKGVSQGPHSHILMMGGLSDFFGSEILTKSDFFGYVKDAGIFLDCEK